MENLIFDVKKNGFPADVLLKHSIFFLQRSNFTNPVLTVTPGFFYKGKPKWDDILNDPQPSGRCFFKMWPLPTKCSPVFVLSRKTVIDHDIMVITGAPSLVDH